MNPHNYSVSSRKRRFRGRRTFRNRVFNKKVRGVIKQTSEKKFVTQPVPHANGANELGVVRHIRLPIVRIPQGTTRETRLGNKISLRYIYINIQLNFQAGNNQYLPLRIQLLTNKLHSNPTLITNLDIASIRDYYAQRTLPDTSYVLMDQYVTTGVIANASPTYALRRFIRVNDICQFDNNAAMTPANKDYVLLLSAYTTTGNGGSWVEVTGYVSCGFVDM